MGRECWNGSWLAVGSRYHIRLKTYLLGLAYQAKRLPRTTQRDAINDLRKGDA